MPSNKQRRDAERLRLQRQLDQRRERELERRRFTLITSIVGTLIAVAAIVTVIVVVGNGDDSTPTTSYRANHGTPSSGQSSAAPTTTPPTTTSPTTQSSTAAALAPPKACATPAKILKGTTATFDGTTVMDATDITKQPTVASKPIGTAKSLECGDVKVGTGKAASPTASVTVQYTGFLYSDGKVFDASYLHGKTGSTFSLSGVVPGFTQGIGGTGKVAPMREGGVRIMILPPSLGYGSQANGSIPANSTLVFVVDLLKVK